MSEEETRFPPQITRTGLATGRSNERTLADELQGAQGFRTRVREHPDGSRTLLRTRNGFPEYLTLGSIDDIKCLLSPLREEEGASDGESMFQLRKWHSFESDPEHPELDHMHDLVSSDGLFSIAPTPLAEWVCKSGDGRTITFFFAEQFPNPSDEAVSKEPSRIIETAWSERTWHAAQMVRIDAASLPVLYFVIERLKSIEFLFGRRTKPFVWTFAGDAGDALTAKGRACMEYDGSEFSLATRVDYANGALKELSLKIYAKHGQIITADPGGWLGALDGPSDGPQSGVELVTLMDTNATNLSRAIACGQPWHGWLARDNMTLLDDTVVAPPGYSPLGQTVEDDYGIAPYQTHYVAIPNLPDVPEDTYPADYASNSMRFLKDAVLFGVARKYSPQSSFELGMYRWFHYSPIDGSVHVLRVEEYLDVGGLNPGRGIDAYVVLTVYDDGALTLNGVVGTPRLLSGEFRFYVRIPQNDISFEDAWTGWWINDTFVERGLPRYPKFRYIPMPVSPTGDRFMYLSASEGQAASGIIYGVCEVTISDDRSSISGELVYDYRARDYDATLSGWWLHGVLESRITPPWVPDPEDPNDVDPGYALWYAHLESEGVEFWKSTSEPRVINYCSGATYQVDGTRVLYIMEAKYALPPFDLFPSGYAFPQYIAHIATSDDYIGYPTEEEYLASRSFSYTMQNLVSIKDVALNVEIYTNTTKISAEEDLIAALSTASGSDQSENCTEPRYVRKWLLSNNLSLVALVALTASTLYRVERVFVRSPNELLPVGDGQPENLEFSAELLATVSGVIDFSIFGWTDYQGGNPNPLYSLGYGCFDPRTGEVRCSFDPTLGYV